MKQTVRVIENTSKDICLVELKRESACGGNCHSCGGCASPDEMHVAKAVNGIGANPGDMVVVETRGSVIFGIAALVYLLPVLLLFAGYIVAELIAGNSVLSGIFSAVGFIVGIIVIVVVGRRRKDNIDLVAVAFH